MKIMRLAVLAVVSLCLYINLIFSNTSQASSTKTVQRSINDTAPVTVKFDGLQAMAIGDPSRISIGILNAPHHTPKLVVTKIKDDSRYTILTLSGEQLRRSLSIDVASGQSGITKYYGSESNYTDWTSDKNDLRWALNITELYKRDFKLRTDKFWGKVHISSGLLYVDRLTEMKYKFFSADGTSKALDFYRQIGNVAAKINLNIGDSLIIKSSDGKINIELPYDGNSRYELELNNLPPESMANVDHFLFYYDVLEEADSFLKYVPVEISRAVVSPRPIVCASVLIDTSL